MHCETEGKLSKELSVYLCNSSINLNYSTVKIQFKSTDFHYLDVPFAPSFTVLYSVYHHPSVLYFADLIIVCLPLRT